MLLKKDVKATRQTRASAGSSFAMVQDLTEELAVTFGERLPRTLIRSYVLEAMLDVRGTLKARDLRSVVALIACGSRSEQSRRVDATTTATAPNVALMPALTP